MAFYGGDQCGSCWHPRSASVIPVSTVLARIYTTEGFVVAADGRKSRGDSGIIITDCQQKIFSIEQPEKHLAYAFAGAVDLTHSDSENVLLDFIDQADKAVHRLSDKKPPALWDFAEMLKDELVACIEEVKHGKDGFDNSIEGSCTHMFMSGYYRNDPRSVMIDFTHHVQTITEAEVTPERVPYIDQYGSQYVWKLLRDADPASLFAAYATPEQVRLGAGLRLLEAVNIALRDVRGHCDPMAYKIDEKACRAIGGHIHIATVTPTNGFQWAPGFEPVA